MRGKTPDLCDRQIPRSVEMAAMTAISTLTGGAGPNSRDLASIMHVNISVLDKIRRKIQDENWQPDNACTVVDIPRFGDHDYVYYATVELQGWGSPPLDINDESHPHKGVSYDRAGIYRNNQYGRQRVVYTSRFSAQDSILWFAAYSSSCSRHRDVRNGASPFDGWLHNLLLEEDTVLVTDISGVCKLTRKVLFARKDSRYYFCTDFYDEESWSVL
jgi:hypothetical protein